MEAYDENRVDTAVVAVVMKTNGDAVTLRRVRGGWVASAGRKSGLTSSTPSEALAALAEAV